MENLKYPIGKVVIPKNITQQYIQTQIQEIANVPKRLEAILGNFDEEMLNKSYRPGGWTAAQLVHHLVDSHLNSYIRFKLGCTENCPTIKPYDENLWADLPDGKTIEIEPSVQIIKGLHAKWVAFLTNLRFEDFDKTIFHPEHQEKQSLKLLLAYYAWHGNHHLAHLESIVSQNT